MVFDEKTYVVAGDTKSGTSVMMAAHYMGGIDMLFNAGLLPQTNFEESAHIIKGMDRETFIQRLAQVDPYPAFEYHPRDNKIMMAKRVQGRVIKMFYDNVIRDMPNTVDNLHVVYMYRDYDARYKANPGIVGQNKRGEVRIPKDKYLEKFANSLTKISACRRVSQLVVVDFDDFIDDPLRVTETLYSRGWEFDPVLAASVVRKDMRHAKRGEA